MLNSIGGIITANCDGPVVIDRIETNGQEPADWTANVPHYVTKYYPGTDRLGAVQQLPILGNMARRECGLIPSLIISFYYPH